MNWHEKVFAYCERGADPSFWAEPLNAASNASFILAASIALALAIRRSVTDTAVRALIALTFIMGIGSFLFHTFATRWSSVADTVPIAIFMFGYIAFALRRFLGFCWTQTVTGLVIFLGAIAAMRLMPCGETLLPITAASGRPCFNGSLAYLPAAATLVLVSAVLTARNHAAARPVTIAALIFALSLAIRTLDFEVCALTDLLGKPRGTHALWHTLNAATLFALLYAAIHDATSRGKAKELHPAR